MGEGEVIVISLHSEVFHDEIINPDSSLTIFILKYTYILFVLKRSYSLIFGKSNNSSETESHSRKTVCIHENFVPWAVNKLDDIFDSEFHLREETGI